MVRKLHYQRVDSLVESIKHSLTLPLARPQLPAGIIKWDFEMSGISSGTRKIREE